MLRIETEVKHQNARRGSVSHLVTGPPFDPRFQSHLDLLIYIEYKLT